MRSADGDFLDFSGKPVLVTGAATGIGRAVAVGFASRGAKVAIGDINEEAARETLDLVAQAGADVLFVRTDVSIKVTIVEPGYFRTEFLTSGSSRLAAEVLPDYEATAGRTRRLMKEYDGKQANDPRKLAQALTSATRAAA